jgi:uncharacterized protein
MAREIVVTGANGWIGGYAGAELARRGWQMIGVSRTPDEAQVRRPEWTWIGVDGDAMEQAVARAGIVLNLAGRHVLEQPWTPEYVQEMRDSRIGITRRVVAGLRRSSVPQRVLASASGFPVYGDVGDRPIREDQPVSRDLVSGAMDADWEREAALGDEGQIRVALLRLGLVLGHDGGAFPVLRQPFDNGAGVVLGTGRQWMPWVHVEDVARLLADIVEDDGYRGPVNLVGPQPARHAEFAQALADATGMGECTGVPVEQVQAMLGGAAELLLASQRMTPDVALRRGFRFAHIDVASTVKDLVART